MEEAETARELARPSVQEPQEVLLLELPPELLLGLPVEPPRVGTRRLLELSRGERRRWCSRRMEVSLETSASPSATMVSHPFIYISKETVNSS